MNLNFSLSRCLLAVTLFAFGGLWLYSSTLRASESKKKFAARLHRQVNNLKTMSTRSRALGGSYAALNNGAAGTYENPAALGAQTTQQAHFEMGYDTLKGGGNHGNVIVVNAGGAVNLNAVNPDYWPRSQIGNRTLGVIIHRKEVNVDDQDGLALNTTGMSLGYGQSFRGGKFYGGIAGSVFQGEFSDDNETVEQEDFRIWEVKVGAIVRASKTLSIGGTLSLGRNRYDDGGSLFGTKAHGYQFAMRVGAAYEVSEKTLLVSDLVRDSLENVFKVNKGFNQQTTWRISAGIEHVVLPDKLTLRGGIYYLSNSFDSRRSPLQAVDDEWVGFTGGISYFRNLFEFSYSLDIRTTGEAANFFKIGIEW